MWVLKGGKTEWKMVNYFGKDAEGTIIEGAAQRVCDRVREMSGGTFEIEIDEQRSGHVPGDKILEIVHEGKEFQCGYSGMYYASKNYRPLYFACAIPFGLNPQEQNAWLSYKENEDDEFTFMQQIYKKITKERSNEKLNIIPFPAGATGQQMGGWFKKKIGSISELAGITMRIPGLGAEVLKKVNNEFNVTDQTIPINTIKEWLEYNNNNNRAAEWTGPYDDKLLKLHEIPQCYYYYPGWWEPGTTFEIQVNGDAWNRLSDENKEIFKVACSSIHLEILNEYEQKNAMVLSEFQTNTSIREKILPFPEDIIKKAYNETVGLLDYYINDDNEDGVFKEVYEEWKKFKERSCKYNNLESKYPNIDNLRKTTSQLKPESNLTHFEKCSFEKR
jgi:TRAP-type mannitol/chloroaromatic compound transport system substrate-binding protein